MKIRNILLIIISILSFNLYSQNTLSGYVYDASTNKTLSGASITNGNSGNVSNADGFFKIDCNNKITVSYVGYQTQIIYTNDCNEVLKVYLKPSAFNLNEIEISATSNQNKNLLYQPLAIAKLSELEINRNSGLYFDDAILTNVPGMIMNRRTVGAGQQFNIRGYGNGARGTNGLNSNFDGQGYKLYLNGIPITDAEGITTMDDIDFGSIGNVEVTKGPAGSLYGLAISGAVNLKSIQPANGEKSLSQQVMFGNYGLQRYTTTLQLGGEKSSILVNYGNQKSDGFSIHSKSHKDFVNFIGNFTPNAKQTINTYIGYSNSYDQRFGELTIDQWNNDDYSGNPEYIKRDAHSNVITYRAGVGHTYKFNNNISNTTTLYGTGFNSNVSSAGGWTDKFSINYGLRSTFDTKFRLNDDISLSGITGIESQRQDAQVIGYSMKQDPSDTSKTWTLGVNPYWVINANTSNVATISKTTSIFTEWTLSLMKDISVTAGIGYSNMYIGLNDRFNTALVSRPTFFEKSYDGMYSPHIAINKVFNKKFSVYASYSKGYKAPVSSYFFIKTPAVATVPPTPASARVNENLKPEIGTQIEVGTKGQLLDNKLTYELNYFNATFSNKMTAIAVVSPLSPNTTLYSYMVNGGEQLHNGVEALVKYTAYSNQSGFLRSLRPFVNFTYSDFKYGDNFTIQKSVVLTENYSGKEVAGVSKIVANAGIDASMNYGLYANLTFNYRDKMPITSLNDYYTKAYSLLNAKIGIVRSLSKHFDLDLYVGGTNLTNTKYFIMVFSNQLPDAYLPAARNANYYGGLNLKYKF